MAQRTVYGPAIVTAGDLAQMIGCFALLYVEAGGQEHLRMRVKILDARKVYDRIDCLVSPVAGDGQGWVSLSRLTLVSVPT